MSFRTLSLAAVVALLAGPAFAQPASNPPASNPSTANPPSTEEFVTKAAISDMFEIQSSEAALSKNLDKSNKSFAERMVKDHQKTTRELKNLVDSGKVKATLPTQMDAEHQKMLDDLKAKSGKDFVQAYDQDQVQGHEDAVALFTAYSKSGDNADLKKWAANTLPTLKEHLAMAKKLK